jgi:hypothetical protein
MEDVGEPINACPGNPRIAVLIDLHLPAAAERGDKIDAIGSQQRVGAIGLEHQLEFGLRPSAIAHADRAGQASAAIRPRQPPAIGGDDVGDNVIIES